MVGAYFSEQGTPIQQAVGSYFKGGHAPTVTAFNSGVFGRRKPGPPRGHLMAFQDGSLGAYFEGSPPAAAAFREGSLGRQLDENYPGPLMAHQDGSLGSLGLPLFVDGRLVEEPITITHGQPSQPGATIGPGDDGGVLGPGAAEGGAMYPEVQPGPLTAFRSGILGAPEYIEQMPGNLTAYREGVVGNPIYDRPAGVGAFGAVGTAGTIDLSNPAVVKEVKMAMAMGVPGVALSDEGSAYYNELFYADPLWGPKATELFAAWLDMFAGLTLPADTPAVPRSELAVEVVGGMYPTARGLLTIIGMGVGSPGQPGNPAWFEANFPNLKAFMDAALQVEMDTSALKVLPPFFSEGERVRAEEGIKMSTVALVGLGVVGVLGAAIVLGTRRKKRSAT
jgi:hypothetical protein